MSRRFPLLALVVAVALLAGGGCEPRQELGPETYRPELRAIGWSADGRRLLLVHREEYREADYGRSSCGGSGLYETDMRSRPRPVVTGEAWCAHVAGEIPQSGEPTLSADGRTLLMAGPQHNRDECGRVSVLDLPTKRWRSHRLCDREVRAAAASPDARRVAAMLGCSLVMGGGEPDRYSPQGCGELGSRLYLMNPDGAARRVIGGEESRSPVWSPDGRQLLVSEPGDWHIVAIDTATGARRVVTRGSENPAWSPDGRWIAFVRWEDPRVSLRVVRTDGTGERTLFVNRDRTTFFNGWGRAPNGTPSHPLWSPDGRRIVFSRGHRTGETLWSVSVDGTGLRRIADRIPAAR